MLPTRPRTKGASSAELEILGKSDRIVAYCLLRHGPASQAALGAATGLSRPTVTAALSRASAIAWNGEYSTFVQRILRLQPPCRRW